MKTLLLLFSITFFSQITFSQHHMVENDIHEAYDFYQSSHEGAKTALHFISECFDCHTIECVRQNVIIAKGEAEDAMRNAHFAKGESHSAKSNATEVCTNAEDLAIDAHGSFHDAKVVLDIATTSLATAHYSDDMSEMHSHLTIAIDHIHDAIEHLNSGVDGLNGALGHLEYCKNR